jgi:hypothetical protein
MKSHYKKLSIINIEFENTKQNDRVDYALDHITKAQSIMFEELEGNNPIGLYSEFRTLIKLLNMYKNSEIKVGI